MTELETGHDLRDDEDPYVGLLFRNHVAMLGFAGHLKHDLVAHFLCPHVSGSPG